MAAREWILAGVLLLGACTPMRWQKVEGEDDAATASSDLAACRNAAQRQAWVESLGVMPMGPYEDTIVRGPDGRLYRTLRHRHPYPGGTNPPDDFFRERDLTDYCMRNKGYRLVPVDKGEGLEPPAP